MSAFATALQVAHLQRFSTSLAAALAARCIDLSTVLLICLAGLTSTGIAGADNTDTTLAFVSNQGSDSVSVIDVQSYQRIATIPVGDQPAGVSVDPAGRRVYVSNPGDGTVSVIDIKTLSLVGAYKVDDGPLALVAGTTVLYVADWYSDDVMAIDTTVPLEDSGLSKPTILTRFSVGRSPSGLVISPDELTLYVSNRDDNNIEALSLQTSAAKSTELTATGKASERRLASTGERPFGMTLSADGKTLYVANVMSDTLSVIDTASMVSRIEVPVGERPYAVTLALEGSRAFVTDQYDDTVTVIDTAKLQVVETLDVDEYPEGIGTHPDDRHVIVANWFSNTVSVIDASTLETVTTIDVDDGPRAYGNFITTSGD